MTSMSDIIDTESLRDRLALFMFKEISAVFDDEGRTTVTLWDEAITGPVAAEDGQIDFTDLAEAVLEHLEWLSHQHLT